MSIEGGAGRGGSWGVEAARRELKHLRFDFAGRTGRQEKSIVVLTKDTINQPITLRLLVTIPEAVTIEPQGAVLAVAHGAATNGGREPSRFLRYCFWVQNFTSCYLIVEAQEQLP